MKTCSKCKEVLPITSFHKGSKRCQCKKCANDAAMIFKYGKDYKQSDRARRPINVKTKDEKAEYAARAGRNMVEDLAPCYVAAKMKMKTENLTPELLHLGREKLLTSRALKKLKEVIKEKLKENNEY